MPRDDPRTREVKLHAIRNVGYTQNLCSIDGALIRTSPVPLVTRRMEGREMPWLLLVHGEAAVMVS